MSAGIVVEFHGIFKLALARPRHVALSFSLPALDIGAA
jgi:hypothetical protein